MQDTPPPVLPPPSDGHIAYHDWRSTSSPLSLPYDLIIADPPYNIGIKYKDDPTGDALDPASYFSMVENAMTYAHRNLVAGGTLAWICPSHHGPAVWALLLKLGFHLVNDCPVIWHERFAQYQGNRGRLTPDYRLIFLAKVPGIPLDFLDNIREPSVRQQMGDKRADPRGRIPGMVWTIRRLQGTSTSRSGIGPTELPPELLDRLILGFSRPGSRIGDLFAGTGSAWLAAIRNSRLFYGFDRSLSYIVDAQSRAEALLNE